MPDITNPIYFELCELGIINPNTIKVLNPKTRDKDIPVLIDETSQVIFLQCQETSEDYYESEKPEDRDNDKAITSLGDGRIVANVALEDDMRRFEQFKKITEQAHMCDFGCGYGGYARLNQEHAASVSGVELRQHCKMYLADVAPDVRVEKSILDFSRKFDIVTLFHVLEHIPSQVAVLRDIRMQLNPTGKVVVEVPHALDFLIQSIDSPAFRNFTFWSEHLVLHTKESITKVLESAGYVDIQVTGYQRYGFTNHLGWLCDGQPGGHDRFSSFHREKFNTCYQDYMKELGASDTLIAIASAGSAS